MSRTYRNRDDSDIWWATQELVRYEPYKWNWFKLDPSSKEAKIKKAKLRSDAYKAFKEPGPAWFRNLMTERPQRRFAKNEIRKWMLDAEYEVMILSKHPLEYWT